MPYTRHGHPFGVIDTTAPRPGVARCGGPAICPACESDVADAALVSEVAARLAGDEWSPVASQWRTGRHQPRMIYAQTPEGGDQIVCLAESAELAAHIVAMQNRDDL